MLHYFHFTVYLAIAKVLLEQNFLIVLYRCRTILTNEMDKQLVNERMKCNKNGEIAIAQL
jgi:hypothetical protein